MGHDADAEKLLRQSAELSSELCQEWPDLPICKTDRVWAEFRLGTFLWVHDKRAEAIEHLRVATVQSIESGAHSGESYDACYARSWCLAACPEDLLRDPPAAIEAACKALDLSNHGRYEHWRALALAEYRAGHFDASLKAGDECEKLHPGGEHVDWLIRAMSLARLGRDVEARSWRERASSSAPNPLDGLIDLLRQEADEPIFAASVDESASSSR